MKKLIAALALVVMSTSALHADFIRVWVGGGMWNSAISGQAQGDVGGDYRFDLKDDMGLDTSSNMYVWAMFKHFLPVIPNVRVEMTNYAVDGTKYINFDFAGTTFTGNTKTEINLNQTDVILYYNLLDNTFWTTLDVGLGAKMYSGDITLTSTLSSETLNIDAPIPYAYLRARVQVPLTGFAVEADTKNIAVGDIAVNDTRLKVDYDVFTSLPFLDLGLEAGYRTQTIKFDTGNSGDPYLDITIDGVFFGANLKF